MFSLSDNIIQTKREVLDVFALYSKRRIPIILLYSFDDDKLSPKMKFKKNNYYESKM